MALSNCTQLGLLNFGENRFSGSLPTWIGQSLLSLRILRLPKNKLNGIIPLQLRQFNKLQILDLAENNLIGEIPRCFGKLSGMMIGVLVPSALSEELESTPPTAAPISTPAMTPTPYDDDQSWQ